MMRARWQQDIRLELMREAQTAQGICQSCSRPTTSAIKVLGDAITHCPRCLPPSHGEECPRCGKTVESSDELEPVCTCPYDDWHEEYPDLEVQEGDE
jgi:predicted amidophosphoribosyltransferase